MGRSLVLTDRPQAGGRASQVVTPRAHSAAAFQPYDITGHSIDSTALPLALPSELRLAHARIATLTDTNSRLQAECAAARSLADDLRALTMSSGTDLDACRMRLRETEQENLNLRSLLAQRDVCRRYVC